MATKTKTLTPALRRALRVLHEHEGRSRYSNATVGSENRVYWSSADRLHSMGLTYTIAGESVLLSVDGRLKCAELFDGIVE